MSRRKSVKAKAAPAVDEPAGEALAAIDLRDAEPSADFGATPELRWVDVGKIVVEPSYQRAVADRGLRNIRQICQNFRWSRFAPVILAARSDGLFAVIDGQHRTIAALTLKIAKIPAQIVAVDARERADAFSYINSAVTALSPMAKYHAAVAAGDETARLAEHALAQAGARVLRYPVHADKMKVGDTLAAVAVMAAVRKYGEQVLAVALAGLVAQGRRGGCNAVAINAVTALVTQRPLYSPKAMIEALGAVAMDRAVDRAEKRRATSRRQLAMILTEELAKDIPEHPDDLRDRNEHAAAVTQAPPAVIRDGALGHQFALSEEIFSGVCAKAGIAFGCSRIEVLKPETDLQRAALGALCLWLQGEGWARSSFARRMPGADLDSAMRFLDKNRDAYAPAVARFEAMAPDAVAMARSAA